jgi:hypothetical protein
MVTIKITVFCDVMQSILKTFAMIYHITRRLFLENSCLHHLKTKKKLNSVAFSPQANYTDRATAACRRS